MSARNKKVVDYSGDVSDFNNNQGSILLLAWSRQAFALSTATDAQIINIDDWGFDVIILFRYLSLLNMLIVYNEKIILISQNSIGGNTAGKTVRFWICREKDNREHWSKGSNKRYNYQLKLCISTSWILKISHRVTLDYSAVYCFRS